MKFKFITVVLTAAITSILTLFIAGKLLRNDSELSFGAKEHMPLPVNYTGFNAANNSGILAPVNFENAAAASVKAVVHIKTTTKARTIIDNNVNDIYSQLFGPRQYYIPSQVESGSGVVISPDGYVVTNNHVIANADEVTVSFNDKLSTQAKVVSKDPSTDLALLKIDGGGNLPYMEMGNSDDVKLGQWVLAVGYPFSLDATVTAGIVSAKGRSIGINKSQSRSAIESFIQTDAAVNPGNSGGALVNTAGQLIGINSAIASPTGSYAGYSYAIPVNIVRKVAGDMMKYGSVQRGYMGIEYLDSKNASAEQIKTLGLDKHEGIYVMNVVPNSGAAVAGLQKGDIITELNGQPVYTQPQLQEQIVRYQPGDNLNVTFFRNNKPMTAVVKLNKAEGPAKVLGAAVRPLTGDEKSKLDISGGVVVTDPGRGPLARQTQIRRGFVITSVNDIAINGISDLQQALLNSSSAQIAGFQPGYQGRYYFNVKNIDAYKDDE